VLANLAVLNAGIPLGNDEPLILIIPNLVLPADLPKFGPLVKAPRRLVQLAHVHVLKESFLKAQFHVLLR
jgi:hypothetical protein